MSKDYSFEKRKYVIGAVAVAIVALYILRVFTLQILSDDYRQRADSNAFRKEVLFPSRGLILDRKGRLMVYNEPSYNINVVMQDQHGIDTLDFCNTVGITREEYIARMADIKDSKKHPNYSRNTPQLFMSQIPAEEFSKIREKLFRFNGFSAEKRSVRCYAGPWAAHVLGDVGEVNQADIDSDSYYKSGDYIGKLGLERSYEKVLRGEKGKRIMLRDVHGRTKGHYQDGKYDVAPVPGRNLTLGIDLNLQALAERLLEGKLGAIVAIEPSTGEVLCMVSSPSYDPHRMEGKQRGKQMMEMQRDPMKPMLNRALSGTYPPGSTFKTSQGLTFLQEGIITPSTPFPCAHGFRFGRLKLGCHSHGSPLPLEPAIATSCNAYFCWGLYHMLGNRKQYRTTQEAMTTWKDYMVSMGFGYRLGIDLPGEARGMIPNAEYYDRRLGKSWSALTVISISIGQGEVTLTPLQIANLGATIANRGYYITPHIVKHIQDGDIADSLKTKHYTKVDKQNYEYIVSGMRRAVTGGTCRAANSLQYEVCGKTGTAQNRGHDHSVFMGFAPMDSPKIAIAVYVENGGFGATYGVPIGALMMEQYINGHLSEASEKKAESFQSRSINYGTRER